MYSFAITILDFVTMLIPFTLRQGWIVYYITAALKPFKTVNDELVSLRDDLAYQMQFNGQTIYLEHVLNDQFDPSNRGIYIEDGANVIYNYLYNVPEQKPPLFIFNNSEGSPLYLNNEIENSTTVQFIVKVPVAVTFDEIIMRIIVDRYKQAGVSYSIETY